MGKYFFSKTIGIFLGTITTVAALCYGFFYLLGTSLGKALGSELDTEASNRSTLEILMSICLLGFITGAGSLGIKSKGWRSAYIGFCILMGTILIVFFFISEGALGKAFEFLILCISLMYFLLGYIVKKEK